MAQDKPKTAIKLKSELTIGKDVKPTLEVESKTSNEDTKVPKENVKSDSVNDEKKTEIHIEGFITEDGFNVDKLSHEQLVSFFSVLIKYIYDTTRLESVTYEDLTYYNRSNKWYDRPKGVSRPHDPNYCCDGYMTCQLGIDEYRSQKHGHVIYEDDGGDDDDEIAVKSSRLELPDDVDEITYNLSHTPDDADSGFYDTTSYDGGSSETSPGMELAFYELIMTTIGKKSLNDVKILSKKCLRLQNSHGINTDHRGSDHTKIILDFHDEFELENNCTLYKFADACYRVKSHKFDYWYELYGAVSIKSTKSEFKIDLGFDHGS